MGKGVEASRCPRCRPEERVLERCAVGPHHGKLECSRCGRFLGWAPAPMTPGRAAAFVMPFGRHEGRALGRIAAGVVGRDYLRRLGEEGRISGGMLAAVRLVLERPTGEGTREGRERRRSRRTAQDQEKIGKGSR